MTADAPSIDLKDVTKTYRGRIHALRGVDIRVHPGEIYGLLGPNGAGKSTLVKIMMTVVRATRVHGSMLGRPIGHKPTLARVGYLPEHHRFPPWLTGRQAIEFSGAMCGIPRADRRRRCSELLDQMRMSEWASTRIGRYSKGMQQRIGIAAALINDPELVILDEPTDGVDPVGRREIRDILVDMRDAGRSVLVNSHILSELELVCDRVGILVKGTVSMQGTIDELTRQSQRYEIEIRGSVPSWIESYKGAAVSLDTDRSLITLPTSDADAIQPALDRLRSDAIPIISVRPFRESLEDLFLRAVTNPETGTTLQPGAGGDAPPVAPPSSDLVTGSGSGEEAGT